jgi:hypothetical protein
MLSAAILSAPGVTAGAVAAYYGEAGQRTCRPDRRRRETAIVASASNSDRKDTHMFRRLMVRLVLPVCVLAAGFGLAARAEDPLPAADEWVPTRAMIVVNVRDAKALLDLALQPGLVKTVEATPIFKAMAANPGYQQFQTVVDALEKRLDAKWQTVLRRLVGGGATWAVGPNQGSILIVDCLDADAAKAMHDLLLQFTGAAPAEGEQGTRVRPTKVGDVEVWSPSPTHSHAVIGRRVVIASSPNVMQVSLDLRAGTGGKSVTSLPGYQQARRAAGPDAAAMMYANTAVLKLVPPVAKAMEGGKEPLVSLLAAPILEAVARSTWLAAALRAKGDTLRLDLVTDGTIAESGAARFAVPAKDTDGALPNLTVPRQIAAISLHRDLRGFYAAKDKLFPERTSGLIFFENMMGIFFTGRDLTEEVLAEMGPTVRMVVAAQQYDPAIGTPGLRLPAFALVLRLEHPADFAIVMEEAWQKALGLINFTQGQKAQPGLIIDRPVHDGIKYTLATYAPPRGKDKDKAAAVDMRYNFRPTLAMPAGYAILSSTDALAEDVMDALKKEAAQPPKPSPGVHSLVELDGAQLTAILAANKDNMVHQSIVDKGNSQEQAETEVGMVLTIVKLLSRATLTVGTEQGRSRATLQVDLAVPAVPAAPAVDGGGK